MKTEYRITGRFRKSNKRHVVDSNHSWTKVDAEHRLREIQYQADWEMAHKRCKPEDLGSFGIGREYYSDYDLLELRIESREVSPWSPIEGES